MLYKKLSEDKRQNRHEIKKLHKKYKEQQIVCEEKVKECLCKKSRLIKFEKNKELCNGLYTIYETGQEAQEFAHKYGKKGAAFFGLVKNVSGLLSLTYKLTPDAYLTGRTKTKTQLGTIAKLLDITKNCADSYLNVVTLFNLNDSEKETPLQHTLSWFNTIAGVASTMLYAQDQMAK
jgi:hypothetical protein